MNTITNITRKAWKAIVSLLAGIRATMDSPGTPAITVRDPDGVGLARIKQLLTVEVKLEAAAEVLGQITKLTANNPALDHYYGRAIHEIASDGHDAASK